MSRQNGWPCGSAYTRQFSPSPGSLVAPSASAACSASSASVDGDVEVQLLRVRRVRPPRALVLGDLLEHHLLALGPDQHALGTLVGHVQAQQPGVEPAERGSVGGVDGDGEDLGGLDVRLAEVERVPGRVGQRDPVVVAGQPAGAEALGVLGGGLDVGDLEVDVHLLGVSGVRPPRRQVVGCTLHPEAPSVGRVERDPLVVAVVLGQPGHADVEVGQGLDVRRVPHDRLQLAHHGDILSQPTPSASTRGPRSVRSLRLIR